VKNAGKLEKLLKGVAPYDRWGVDVYGTDFDENIFALLWTAKEATKLESEDEDADRAGKYWDFVLGEMQKHLRLAIESGDGAFFKKLASHIRPKPIDAARVWWDSLFMRERTSEGFRDVQRHTDKTGAELYDMYKAETPRPHTSYDSFTKFGRTMGAKWRDSRGVRKKSPQTEIRPKKNL
jgi:hypothetical protein